MKWKHIVLLGIFIFAAFCQLPKKARAEWHDIPDRTPVLQKIHEAQRIAATAERTFQEILRSISEIEMELSAINGKKNARQRSLELRSVLKTLVALKERSLEKPLLVVWDQETGALNRIYAQEPEYIVKQKRRGKQHRPRAGTENYRSYAPECTVDSIDGNGHGKNFLVMCGNRVMPVLTLAHFHETAGIYSRDISHVYTPYSAAISTPDVIAEGKRYTRDIIQRAMYSLEKKQVPSRAYPGEIVHERFSPEFIEASIINEHMDHDEFADALLEEVENEKDDTKKRSPLASLVQKVFAIIGANRERAFIFSVSEGAHACCLTQFIQSTYKDFVLDLYPTAYLSSNFFTAMRDHQTAVEAMILLFDHDLSEFSPKVRELCESSRELLEDCLAVAYNGGAMRLNNVIEKHGENWDETRTVIKRKRRFPKNELTPQTRIYLRKLREIRKLEKEQ